MREIQQVAVVGSGTMGRQISLQVARHGLPVALFDLDDAALEGARTAHEAFVAEWVTAGKLAASDVPALFERLRYVTEVDAAVRGADLVIEVVPERVEVKRPVFAQLDAICDDHTIIATNSSSIRVSLLEDAVQTDRQVANLHFYIPVWDHPMVEIGGGSTTTPDTIEALTQFARRIGMLPLIVRRESTGFIFNRVWRAIKKEVLKVVDSGVASFEDVDRAWMVHYGTAEGPFGKMDTIGLDVIKDIEEHYARESGDPSDLPPAILTDRVARGDLGWKTGRGFYTYPHPAYAEPNFLSPDAGNEERAKEA